MITEHADRAHPPDSPPTRPTPILALVTALILIVGLGSSCTRAPRHSSPRKRHVVTLPKNWRGGSVVFADDGEAYAFVTTTPEGQRVVTAERVSEPHQQCGRPVFAPKSRRLFYWTLDQPAEEPQRIALLADGTPIDPGFTSQGKVVFSDDGTRWAAGGLLRGRDGEEPGLIVLLADGAEVGRYTDVSVPSFSRDGRHLAYLAENEDRRLVLVVDGHVVKTFDAPQADCAVAAKNAARRPDLPERHRTHFLAEGSVLSLTRDRDGWGIYRNDVRIASYAVSTLDTPDDACKARGGLAVASLRVAETAPFALWWERMPGEEERWRVVRDGQPLDDVVCDAPWRTQPPEISRDSTHHAYPCLIKTGLDESEARLITDRGRYGPYKDVWGIAFADNGAHLAYAASDGEGDRPWSIYVDGQARGGRWAGVWRPRVADDGTVAWQARLDRAGRGALLVNDRRVGTFDEILWGPQIEDADHVAWIIRRGRKLTRITAPLGDGPLRRRSR